MARVRGGVNSLAWVSISRETEASRPVVSRSRVVLPRHDGAMAANKPGSTDPQRISLEAVIV